MYEGGQHQDAQERGRGVFECVTQRADLTEDADCGGEAGGAEEDPAEQNVVESQQRACDLARAAGWRGSSALRLGWSGR